MEERIIGGTIRVRFLLAAILILLAGASRALADEWTTYAAVNDQRDLAAVGNQLWIATSGGAVRYNTVTESFINYPRRSAGGPASQDLTSACYFQPEGLVFFGSTDRGVSIYDTGTDRWRRFEFIADNNIQGISCIGSEVLVATAAGFTIRRSAFRSDICNAIDRGLCCGSALDSCEFPSFNVRDFEELGSSLWTATANGPAENDGSGWVVRKRGAFVTDARSLLAWNGSMILATPAPAGVFRWNPGSQSWEAMGNGLPNDRTLDTGVRLFSLPGAGENPDLWVATGFGAFRWDGAAWVYSGLGDIPVRALAAMPALAPATGFEIYAATARGLYRHVSGADWTALPAPGPPLTFPGQAIDVDRNGVVWVGTTGGAMSLSRDGAWTSYQDGHGGIDPSDIYSLFTDSRNRVWLGKCCCGSPPNCPLQFLDAGTPSANLEAWDGWGLAEDAAGRMWVGSNTDGLHVLNSDGSVLTTIGPSGAGLRSTSVRAVAALGNKIYLGHESRGLQILDHGGNPTNAAGFVWRTFGSGELPDQAVADIALEGNVVWVLTSAGLHRLSGENLSDYRLDFDGEPRRGSAVDVDRSGNKWVATNNGVIRFDRSGGTAVFNTSNSDLINDEVVDVAVDPTTGDILFETRIGTSRLKPGNAPTGETSEIYAYPNPFHPGGGALVKVGGTSADNATVTDLLGRPMAIFNPGQGWDGFHNNRPVAPGIYLITVGGQSVKFAVVD